MNTQASYDIAIVGLGPAGATLARLLGPEFSTLALDKKQEGGEHGFKKPCGGLLAPDAQKALARFDLSLPLAVMASPQIFSVRTIDAASGLTRHYQRHYINVDRHAFDQWLVSLIPATVDMHRATQCLSVSRSSGKWELAWREDGKTFAARARYLVGADGAASLVRRSLFPDFAIRKYLAVQQWFEDAHAKPFYSCIFEPGLTDCYAWGLSKNGRFIFGGAFEPHKARKNFESLKHKMRAYGFCLDRPLKTEACMVLRPAHLREINTGAEGCFLLGEAAGFISPSSLEGLSYAFDSARILADILNSRAPEPHRAYFRKTLPLRAKILGKLAKSPFIFSPVLRKLVMSSGIGSIPVELHSLPGAGL